MTLGVKMPIFATHKKKKKKKKVKYKIINYEF